MHLDKISLGRNVSRWKFRLEKTCWVLITSLIKKFTAVYSKAGWICVRLQPVACAKISRQQSWTAISRVVHSLRFSQNLGPSVTLCSIFGGFDRSVSLKARSFIDRPVHLFFSSYLYHRKLVNVGTVLRDSALRTYGVFGLCWHRHCECWIKRREL